MPFKNPEDAKVWFRERMRRNRAEFFKDKCCAKCGSRRGMELDHRNPSKKVSHRIWSWSRTRREAELKKCQVLCAEHHKEKTSAERSVPIQHGTWQGYARYCRCNACTAAHADYQREYRERTGHR